MDNQTPTPPFVIPPTKKRTISFTYVTDAFFNSVQRFPVTLIYLAAFIIWGLIDIWTPYGFFRDSADPLIQNLEPALWFLTVNGMLLSLAVYLWCEQSAHKFLCLKCQIVANILLALDFVNILFNFQTFTNSVWVARVAIETALVVSILFVPAFRKGSSRHNLMFSFSQFGNAIIAFVITDVIAIASLIIFATISLLFNEIDYKFTLSCELIFAAGLGILVFIGRIPTFTDSLYVATKFEYL